METERKEKMDLDDEQRRQKLIADQVSEGNPLIVFIFCLDKKR